MGCNCFCGGDTDDTGPSQLQRLPRRSAIIIDKQTLVKARLVRTAQPGRVQDSYVFGATLGTFVCSKDRILTVYL